MKCDYGCNQTAKYTFKNRKKCCSKSSNTCLGKRGRDSLKKKGKIPHPNSGNRTKGRIPWNKNNTYDILLGEETSQKLKDKISKSLIGKSLGIASSPEKEKNRRKKISETMKKNPNSGGYRQGSGRGKSGYYKGIWCDSSWELAFVIYNIDHNISFIRNNKKFEYIFEDKTRHYLPDFIIDNIYYEIKGYETEQWYVKKSQFNFPLIVLGKKEIQKYLKYVIDKYGKDFIKMYEARGRIG